MIPSARTQFYSFVLFDIARFQLLLVALLLKASIMRLLGVPLPSFIPRAAPCWKLPWPGRFFFPSCVSFLSIISFFQ
jgi:hypothetical protein